MLAGTSFDENYRALWRAVQDVRRAVGARQIASRDAGNASCDAVLVSAGTNSSGSSESSSKRLRRSADTDLVGEESLVSGRPRFASITSIEGGVRCFGLRGGCCGVLGASVSAAANAGADLVDVAACHTLLLAASRAVASVESSVERARWKRLAGDGLQWEQAIDNRRIPDLAFGDSLLMVMEEVPFKGVELVRGGDVESRSGKRRRCRFLTAFDSFGSRSNGRGVRDRWEVEFGLLRHDDGGFNLDFASQQRPRCLSQTDTRT
ncbi:hypothetical protein DFJ73DRAFT_759843 [Zopfochytrium polystomum]|nr:hypothetical protein DFJ73DRAFT_759843 [Zopfochytrium polystomum]